MKMGPVGESASRARNPIADVWGNRNFRLLWIGQGTSWLGDQFRWIALPWLVLQLTHDPLALGGVLAVGGIPEAVMTLIGGAVADRFSPRRIMLLSDLIRLVLSALLMFLTLSGAVQVWMLYFFSFALGAVAGLFSPASGAVMPMIVPQAGIRSANSVSQGTMQLIMFIGPALAGGVIGAFGNESMSGITVAFAFDALTFLVSVLMLWLMVIPPVKQHLEHAAGILESVKAGITYAWHDPVLRLMFTVIILNNLLIGGTLAVGIPVMADARLSEGAAALGLIWAGLAGGTLAGVVLSGLIGQRARFSLVGAFAVSFFGAGLIALAFVSSTWAAFLIMLAVGVAGGYINVMIPTFLQRRTPQQFIGRVMSLLYFAGLGLSPLSKAVAGVVVKMSFFALFAGAGILLILLTVWLVMQPDYREIDRHMEEMTA